MTPSHERRQYPRVKYPFMVKYQSRRQPGTWRMAPLNNLSLGGVRFVCECAFDVGETLELQFVLPTAKTPVSVRSRVVWATLVNEKMKLYEYGVTFDTLTPEARAVLDPVVSHLLRKQSP